MLTDPPNRNRNWRRDLQRLPIPYRYRYRERYDSTNLPQCECAINQYDLQLNAR